MNDAIEEMKIRAGLLLKQARLADEAALARVRRHAKELTETTVQRKHCLEVIARELGFTSFRHAREVIEADADVPDFGSLLYDRRAMGTLNHWFSSYDEARAHLETSGGYLLPYRTQFMVVPASFVSTLGLEATHEAWTTMGRDWVRPEIGRAHV